MEDVMEAVIEVLVDIALYVINAYEMAGYSAEEIEEKVMPAFHDWAFLVIKECFEILEANGYRRWLRNRVIVDLLIYYLTPRKEKRSLKDAASELGVNYNTLRSYLSRYGVKKFRKTVNRLVREIYWGPVKLGEVEPKAFVEAYFSSSGVEKAKIWLRMKEAYPELAEAVFQSERKSPRRRRKKPR